MAEYLRPDADVALDGWTDQAAGSANIYQALDEATAGDSDYVQSPPSAGGGGSGSTITIGDQFSTAIAFGRTFHQKSAQHFISAGETISQITVWLLTSSTPPTDGVQIKIFTTDGSHNPTTTQVGVTSSVVAAADIAAASSPETFTFIPPVPVTVGVEYCFVVERTGATNDTVNFLICRQESPDAYVPGYYHFMDAGGAWVNTTTRDIVCIIQQPAAPTADLKVRLIEAMAGGGVLDIGAAGATGFYFGFPGYTKVMQSFTSIGNTVLSVKAWFSTSNYPSDNVVAKLHTADASHYPATLIATSSAVAGSSMPANTPDYWEFTFTFTGVSISPGVEYCIVLERTGSATYSHYYLVKAKDPGGYAGGILATFNNVSWSVPGSIVTYDLTCAIDQGSGGSDTQIAEWTHTDIAETFTGAEQTLTAPQVASITDFANLFVELDDNQGSVYRFAMGNPLAAIEEPIKVRYRYKKELVAGEEYSAEAIQFFDRTSGLTEARKAIYNTYINALVLSGVWAKLHWHYLLAAPNTATALTNLKSGSFGGTTYGSPTFTADVGYTGSAGTGAVIGTGYNPSTQSSQNDAHLSVWIGTESSAGYGNAAIGCGTGGPPYSLFTIHPKFNGDSLNYFRCNSTDLGESVAAPSDLRGLYVATRASSSIGKGYVNGVDKSVPAGASIAPPNQDVVLLGENFAGTNSGVGWLERSASAGANLTAAEVTAFYNAQVNFYAALLGR